MDLPDRYTFSDGKVITRAEWAQRERTYFYDDSDPLASVRASDYATPEEIAAIIGELTARRNALLPALRAAKAAAGPYVRAPGETARAWVLRYFKFDDDAQELAAAVGGIEDRRQRLFRAAKELRGDRLPSMDLYDDSPTLLVEVEARRTAAVRRELERREAEYAARPVGDREWDDELRRLAGLDRYLTRGPIIERVRT